MMAKVVSSVANEQYNAGISSPNSQRSLHCFCYDDGESRGRGDRSETITPRCDTLRHPPAATTKHAVFQSLQDAQKAATAAIRQLPIGYAFTVMGLFKDWRIAGCDARIRAGLITPARNLKLIICDGLTRDDQESRNHGYAARWVRVGGV
jgi:hypothetical protein